MPIPSVIAIAGSRLKPAPITTPPPPPPAVTLISRYKLDSASADDDVGGVHGAIVGTWTATTTGSLVAGVAGQSFYKDGTTSAHITFPANNPVHALSQMSIDIRYQPVLNSNKHILLASKQGATSQPGDLSIERLTNGQLNAYHVGADGALRRFGGAVGIAGTNLLIDKAYHIILTFGPAGAKIYLLQGIPQLPVMPVATIPENTNGWNNASVKFLGIWVDGLTDPAQGLFDHVRIWSGQMSDSDVAALEDSQDATSPTGEYITTPEAHGWSAGNTVAQNTTAFNDAIVNASANAGSSSTGRGVVELVQGKTYVVRANPGTQANPSACILINSSRQNVEIRTAGRPIIGSGNQATIQVESWAGKTGQRRILNVFVREGTNVRIGWLRIDGNKASCAANFDARTDYAINNIDYTEGGNGGLSTLRVSGGQNITLKEVEAFNALTDGFALTGSAGSGGTGTTAILVEDCDFHHCRRMGWTVSGGPAGRETLTWDQCVFRRVKARFSGDEAGVMVGNAPAAGTDLEPLQTAQTMYGLTMEDCEWSDNKGSTFDSEGGNIGLQPISGGRGIVSDTHSNCFYFKMLNCRSDRNRAEAYQFNMREGADFDHVDIRNLVASGNGNNRLAFNNADSGAVGQSQVRDTIIVNCNVATIFFEDELAATGHSVHIWRGDFNPTITTNGRATITLHNGFPP